MNRLCKVNMAKTTNLTKLQQLSKHLRDYKKLFWRIERQRAKKQTMQTYRNNGNLPEKPPTTDR